MSRAAYVQQVVTETIEGLSRRLQVLGLDAAEKARVMDALAEDAKEEALSLSVYLLGMSDAS